MIFLPLVALAAQASSITSDPAFIEGKKLLGSWEGLVAGRVKVQFKFTLEQNGTLLVGIGTVGAGSAHPMPVRSSLGWDPVAKQVYYLDQHGSDTVYFGHLSTEDGDVVFDFNGIVGDLGHYRSRVHITKDTYNSTMDAEQKGKWTDMGVHLVLHRVKG